MGSFGSALRRTREQKGISLDDIAGETRLSRRYLLALEDEAIHKLPGGTYNRAYLRTYAGYLGLDAEWLVRRVFARRGAPDPDRDAEAAARRACLDRESR